jgi:hypothetical protein
MVQEAAMLEKSVPLNQPAVRTHPADRNEPAIISFVQSLHFYFPVFVLTELMLDVREDVYNFQTDEINREMICRSFLDRKTEIIKKIIVDRLLLPDIPAGHRLVKHLFTRRFCQVAYNGHGNHGNDKCVEGKMHG